MSFNPNSTIYLCKVDFDNTYKNQVYFSNKSEQSDYFINRSKLTLSKYLTVRETLPNGGVQSSIKVGENIDTLRNRNINYMMYQNLNHRSKWFYAFITKLIYVNEETTKIVFESDVFQTWLFDIEILDSFVVREHSVIDKIGDNLIPEKFNFNEYNSTFLTDTSELDEWGYLVGSTNMRGAEGSRGKQMSGIYQGLHFYYFTNTNNMNDFLDTVEEEDGDCIQFIATIPKFCLLNNNITGGTESEKENGEGYVSTSPSPSIRDITIDMTSRAFSFDGYIPKNNKLFTFPFMKLIVTNHAGQEGEYIIEDFGNKNMITFKMCGDVSTNPSIMLYPKDYKGIADNIDSGLSISGFPQCSVNTDMYKLWLAKNQFGMGLNLAGNIGNIAMGVGTIAGTGGLGVGVGGMQVMTGVTGMLDNINTFYQAQKEPNKVTQGNTKNNLLTAMKKNKFEFYIQTIKRQYAEMVDDFFTMYGYQVNKIKKPNLNSRKYFNYVQTIDINIVGGVPNDDLTKIKAIFNQGVTLWKKTSKIGDYSVDNSIESEV
jgi:hypothetical protein